MYTRTFRHDYLHGHFLGLFLHLLDDLVARASIVSSGRGAVFLPFLKTNPAEIILALQRDRDENGEQDRTYEQDQISKH